MLLTQVICLCLKQAGYQPRSFFEAGPIPIWFRKPPAPIQGSTGFIRRFQKQDNAVRAKHDKDVSNVNIKLKLLAVTLALSIIRNVPDITLKANAALRSRLRKKCHHKGYLSATKVIDADDILRLRSVIGDLPQGVIPHKEDFVIIVDTGCSSGASGYESDFVPGSLKPLENPVVMDGIAGGLPITHQGLIRTQVITTTGPVRTLEFEAYLVLGLQCRLFSPQRYLMHQPSDHCKFSVLKNRSELDFGDGEIVDIPYDQNTYLPLLYCHKDALGTANALALKSCVSDETNQNLTRAQRILLRHHFRLGHTGFRLVQWLGRNGWLGNDGISMGKSNCDVPKCAACQLGKQSHTPSNGRGTHSPRSRHSRKPYR